MTVTHLDGLVFARTTFDSSMRYRSAWSCTVGDGARRRREGGGADDAVRAPVPRAYGGGAEPTDKELAATLVLRVPLEQASVKVAEGPPEVDPVRRGAAIGVGGRACRWRWSPGSRWRGPTYLLGWTCRPPCTGRCAQGTRPRPVTSGQVQRGDEARGRRDDGVDGVDQPHRGGDHPGDVVVAVLAVVGEVDGHHRLALDLDPVAAVALGRLRPVGHLLGVRAGDVLEDHARARRRPCRSPGSGPRPGARRGRGR